MNHPTPVMENFRSTWISGSPALAFTDVLWWLRSLEKGPRGRDPCFKHCDSILCTRFYEAIVSKNNPIAEESKSPFSNEMLAQKFSVACWLCGSIYGTVSKVARISVSTVHQQYLQSP